MHISSEIHFVYIPIKINHVVFQLQRNFFQILKLVIHYVNTVQCKWSLLCRSLSSGNVVIWLCSHVVIIDSTKIEYVMHDVYRKGYNVFCKTLLPCIRK